VNRESRIIFEQNVGISLSKAEKFDDGKIFDMQNAFCLTLLNPT
jgi:hypothetical protein